MARVSFLLCRRGSRAACVHTRGYTRVTAGVNFPVTHARWPLTLPAGMPSGELRWALLDRPGNTSDLSLSPWYTGLIYCWLNGGPTFATLARHSTSTGIASPLLRTLCSPHNLAPHSPRHQFTPPAHSRKYLHTHSESREESHNLDQQS